VLHIFLAQDRIIPNKILMDAQVVEVQAQAQGVTFEALQIAVLFTGQLAVEQLNANQT
jgi:hypothetical protein